MHIKKHGIRLGPPFPKLLQHLFHTLGAFDMEFRGGNRRESYAEKINGINIQLYSS